MKFKRIISLVLSAAMLAGSANLAVAAGIEGGVLNLPQMA